MTHRHTTTVTGSRFFDVVILLALLGLLVAKAPRLAVYYKSPPAPAAATVSGEKGAVR